MSARVFLAAPLAVTLSLIAGLACAAEPQPPVSDGMAVPAKPVPPQYPKKALKQKADGCVVLSFQLDAEGHASDFKVIESRPQGMFDAATLKVMDQWTFQPPPRAGRYAQLVQFRLEGRAPVNVCAPLPGFTALNPGEPPLTRQIQVLSTVMPRYERAGKAVDGGCVTVRYQIRHDGFVGDVQVIEARPASLGPPTVEAIKQWVFRSFPPPDLYTTQTFNYTPEQMRMPENMIRSAYADVAGADVRAIGCGGKPAAKAAVTVEQGAARQGEGKP